MAWSRTCLLILLLISSTRASTSVAQGMLEQRLSEPVLLGLDSKKQIAELEYCVANAITATTGVPQGAYRDGDERVVIFSNRIAEVKVFLAVTLTKTISGTKIEVRGRNEKAIFGFQEVLGKCI